MPLFLSPLSNVCLLLKKIACVELMEVFIHVLLLFFLSHCFDWCASGFSYFSICSFVDLCINIFYWLMCFIVCGRRNGKLEDMGWYLRQAYFLKQKNQLFFFECVKMLRTNWKKLSYLMIIYSSWVTITYDKPLFINCQKVMVFC